MAGTAAAGWDWLPWEWMSPFPKEATSKTRRAQPWDWLPWAWMSPFPKEATSKARPYHRLLPAASAHFAPGQVDTSSLVLSPLVVLEDCRGLWTRVLAMVPA